MASRSTSPISKRVAAYDWQRAGRELDELGHALLPRLLSMVRPGGQLAVQQPSNFRHPTHLLIEALDREEPFREALDGYTRPWPLLSIDEYAELLYACGATDIHAFENTPAKYRQFVEGGYFRPLAAMKLS